MAQCLTTIHCRSSIVFIILILLNPTLSSDPKGICTDTRCNGAATLCCEGSTALQKKDICNGAVTCDSCCGWVEHNHTVPTTHGICTDTRCGGSAKGCCQETPFLQKKDVCNADSACGDCCGWMESDKSALKAQSHSKSVERPHVLFMFVDDLGWADIGAHNAGYETKNIDDLLKSGIELTNYHVNLVCSPSRASLMTGQYAFKLGLQSQMVIQPMTKEHIPFEVPTFAELMKKAGYQTHMLGKWHLGYASWNMTPTGRGFDSHYGYFQGAEDYYTHDIAGGFDFFRNRNVQRNVTGSYSTTLYDEHVTQLLDQYHQSDSKEPLFIYMAFQTPHFPIEAPPQNYSQCDHVEGAGRQTYCNKMQYLDEVILHYIDMFKGYNLWDDTLLVFSADNGGQPPNHGGPQVTYGCNIPYRAGKSTLFEGGVKGAGFINGGDNVIPSKLRGTSSNILTHVMDWLPTIVHGVAKQELPSDVAFDGMSMWNALMNPENVHQEWNRTTLYVDIEENGKFAGLIDGDYKYFQGEQIMTAYFKCGETKQHRVDNDNEWLFNLKDDPYEQKNIATENKEIVKKYKAMIEEYVKSDAYVEEQSARTYPDGNYRLHDGVWLPWLD